ARSSPVRTGAGASSTRRCSCFAIDEIRRQAASVFAMTDLVSLLEAAGVPGAAALVSRGGEVEVACTGEIESDSIVRIASLTKPITAAATMLLVDEGTIALDAPVARWLPEIASPRVVRTPESPIGDVVP